MSVISSSQKVATEKRGLILTAALVALPVVTPEVISKMVTLIGGFMQGQTGHFGRLKDLHQPVLIVAGDRDPFFPLKNMWILYRELPNAQLSVFPQAGHGPHQQHPIEVAAQVEHFLAAP